MLGRNFNPDEFIAHDDVVQQIWNGGTENNGLHFAPEEDAMVVQLGVVCTGTVRVKETLNKWTKYNTLAKHISNTIQSSVVE